MLQESQAFAAPTPAPIFVPFSTVTQRVQPFILAARSVTTTHHFDHYRL